LADLIVAGIRAPSGGTAPPDIAGLLGRFSELSPPVPSAGAAVTIVLRDGASDVETLLVVRADNPQDPGSGQIGLPGGHVNEGDENLLGTALRELGEEVGLTGADLAGTPRYVKTEPARAFRVHVAIFAAALGASAARPRAGSVKEIAHVFWLPRSALEVTRRVARDTVLGSVEVNATIVEGRVLWGFTRRVLRDFFGFPVEDEHGGPALPAQPP
jgi:8-oxo-dGTP pyrophosphatase MutT (NUDIX family)